MKLSRFNLWVKDYPKKDEYLLFNSRTQALIKINQELKHILDNLKDSASHSYPSRIEENIKALKVNGIIVEDEKDEEKKIENFFQQLKYDNSVLPFEVTILTTYSCNFKCVYCFEESVKDSVFLDKDNSDLIIKWIINQAEKKQVKNIFLVYYGGEPLLNVGPIYNISWHLKQWAALNGVTFGFGIITNGSLINPELIDKLLTVGLKELRISIDGHRQEHNEKRPFTNGKPTFDIIVDNIKRVIDKVRVGIMGNFDRDNYESIFRFLDYLDNEGLLHKFEKINFSPLMPRLGKKSNPGKIELGGCLSFFEKDGLFKEVIAIKKDLIRRGFHDVDVGMAVNACSLIMKDAGVTIDPKGIIYKCNSLVGYPEFSVGNVRNNDFNSKLEEFLNIDAWNKCPPDCPYIPMCQGGCRFFSYLENKNFNSQSCKKEYLDLISPELIKMEYEKLIKG